MTKYTSLSKFPDVSKNCIQDNLNALFSTEEVHLPVKVSSFTHIKKTTILYKNT